MTNHELQVTGGISRLGLGLSTPSVTDTTYNGLPNPFRSDVAKANPTDRTQDSSVWMAEFNARYRYTPLGLGVKLGYGHSIVGLPEQMPGLNKVSPGLDWVIPFPLPDVINVIADFSVNYYWGSGNGIPTGATTNIDLGGHLVSFTPAVKVEYRNTNFLVSLQVGPEIYSGNFGLVKVPDQVSFAATLNLGGWFNL